MGKATTNESGGMPSAGKPTAFTAHFDPEQAPGSSCADRRSRLLVLFVMTILSVCVSSVAGYADTTSTIRANFNGTAISGGNTIWFTSVLKPSGLGSSPVTIFVRKSTITFTANGTNYTITAPDSNVIFSPTATSATISFDSTKNVWQITVPSSGLAGNTLLDAVQFAVPAGGLPGGIQNVTWQANFSTDTSGISMNWQWAAAVYTSFNANYTSLGVKPVDDTKASQYPNSDHAGTPENYKSDVVGGAMGGGSSNFTGSYSGTASLSLPVAQAPTANAGGPYNAYLSQPVTFNGSASSDPNGYTLNYNWNFGDGTTGTGATPTHTYSSAGSFTITLTVDDGRNVTGTATVKASITAPPPPTITATVSPAPNANGWNNSSVTVTFICSDSTVGIKSCPSPLTVSTEGANQVVQGTAVNNGGVSSNTSVKVNVDRTPPTIVAALTPAPNSSGWNNSDVTVSFNCTDSLSGIANCPQPILLSSSGANQIVSGTATDSAGNTASTSIAVNIELTLPSIAASVSTPPNAQGWNNTNVTVSFTCAPSTAAIVSCPQPQTISTDGAGRVISGTVTDAAGYTNTAKVTLNIAKTPPTIAATVTPQPNSNGWNTSPATVTFTCTQTVAPLATCPQPQTVSTEGANQAVTGTVTDIAGNSASTTARVSIATIPPTITGSISPQPNSGGWNNSPVTVTFNCTATTAPIASCPQARTVSAEGANQTIPGTATDAAGNAATVDVSVSIDTTPPVISYSISPTPDSNGVNTVLPVTITFTCTDALSGVASCPSAITVTAAGMNQSFAGTATDVAGNTSTANVTVNVAPPLIPPSISAVASPVSNPRGWNNSNVTVTFACSPGSNPVASCPSPTIVSTEGANQQVCGTAVDTAGLSAQGCVTVNLDKTPPTISATASPVPSGIWNTTPVTLTFTCADSLSGIATCPSPQTVSTNGAGQTVTGTAVDLAGNQGTTQVTLNIDQTPPSVLQFTAPSQLAPGQSGTATVNATDSVGIASVILQLNGNSIATITTPPYTATVTTPSTANAGDSLTLTAIVTDVAGLTSSSSRTIQVVSSGIMTGQVLSDVTGLPLPGATVQIIGGGGQDTSDSNGRYSIPSSNSHLFLSFSMTANQSTGAAAMVTVEREVFLQSGVGTVPLDARMSPLAAPISINSTGGALTSSSLTLVVAPGTVSSTTNFYLTQLSQQGLPALLPLGWSPVVAFDLQTDNAFSSALSANFAQIPSSLTLHLVRYDYPTHSWIMVAPNLSASNGTLTTAIPSVGDFALVTADAGNTSIIIPTAGQPIAGVAMVTLPAGASASGSMNPPSVSPAGGTSAATLNVQSSVPLPSGTVIQAQVQETYTLTSGKQLSSSKRLEDILLYQYAAAGGAAGAATFPVTASQTFALDVFSIGKVRLDILSGRESIRGQVGGNDAVTVTGGNATLTVSAGSLPQDTAISVNPEGVDTFLPSSASLIPLAEYNLDFSGETLTAPAQLSVAAGSAQPGDNVLVAQIQRINDVPYLVVVSLAQVNGANLITQAAPGFSGITQEGDYVFYKVTSPTGYVSGTVTNSGNPVAAMVQTDSLPFVSFSSFSGSYVIPALAGTVNLTTTVPNTALAGSASAQVTAANTTIVNLNVIGQSEAATVNPPNGAVGIPLTAEIDVTAPDPFNQASVTSTTVTLAQNAQGTPTQIPIRFVFSQNGTRLSVFPVSALQPSTTYTLAASGLANTLGGLITVPNTTFTTQANTPPNFNTNALVFSMPDQNGNVQISAPANSFPPGTIILIVDQTNGVVLSLTVANDGSVSGQMPATINDLMQITITDPAGNVTTFTRSQFVAADGTVAVGPGGGSINGPGGTGLIIPAGALGKGTTFKLSQFDQTAFPDMPDVDNLQFGSGLRVDTPPNLYNNEIKLVFPVPPGAASGAEFYVYRRVVFPDGTVGYEAIDEAAIQGSGTSAQVVTASWPFSGYFQQLSNGISYFYLTYIVNPVQGVYSQGAITGRILGSQFQSSSQSQSGCSTPTACSAVVTFGIGGARVYTNKPGVVSQANRGSVFAYSQAGGSDPGRYTLWDPDFKGGSITVQADGIPYTPANPPPGTPPYTTTAFEIQSTDSFYSLIVNGLLGKYRNVAVGDITIPPPAPPQPPPAFNIYVMQDNNGTRTNTSGLVTAGASLVIGINSPPGSAQGVTPQTTFVSVNGQSQNVSADSQGQFSVIVNYVPSLPGVYAIQVTALNAFGGPPTVASYTFRAIGAGSSINSPTPGAAPTVLTGQSYPTNGATQVPVDVNPLIVFSEPVIIPAGGVQLQDSSGNIIASLIGGVDDTGTPWPDISKAPATTHFTSVTIQPLQNLHYSGSTNDPNGTYQIVLSSAIKDLNQPQLTLAPGQSPIVFSTYQIPVLSTGGAAFASPGIFVAKDRAYVAQVSSRLTTGTVWQYDVSNPASPVAITPANDGSIEGRANHLTGEDNSIEAGGNALIAVSVAPYPFSSGSPPQTSYVMLYQGTSSAGTSGGSNSLTWIGAVSLTSGPLDGTVNSIAVKANRLYAATTRKGIQVVDIDQVKSEFTGTLDPVIYHGINTQGQGFAMDAVIATIPIQSDPTVEYLDNLYDIKVSDYSMAGQNETLAVATGWVPLGSVTSPAVSLIVADPNAQTIVSKTMPQSGAGSLRSGQALALGPIQSGTTSTNIAAVVGGGSTANCGNCNVLAVIDMTDPTNPQPLSFTALSDAPTDVLLNGNTAIIGYAGDSTELFDLSAPMSPQSLGVIQGMGGKLFLYGGSELFSTGEVPGSPSSALGGIHMASFNTLQLNWQALNSALDNNPNVGGGLRIFPDKQTSTDTLNRALVQLKAQVQPAVSGTTVYFRVFDVPDPSVPNSPPNDNNGVPNFGTLSAGSAVTDATGTAVVTFTVTMQPGDNFVGAASTNASQLNAVNATAQGLRNAAGNPLPDGISSMTPMLTVWRRLHVEIDSMAAVQGNTVTGNITGYSQNELTVDTNLDNGSFNLDSVPQGNGRFENGYITIANAMMIAVQTNGIHHVDSANGFAAITQAQMPFVAANGEANTAGNSVGFAVAGANWTFTVKVPHTNAATAWAGFVGGTISVSGGPAMTITAVQDTGTIPQNPGPGVQQFDTAQITVSNLAIPFSMLDDDQAVMPTPPDTSYLAIAYGDAYMLPVIDGGGSLANNQNNLPFILNVNTKDTNPDGTFAFSNTWKGPGGFQSEANRSDSYWIVYALAGYQPGPGPNTNPSNRTDGDPDSLQALAGISDHDGALIFVETARDVDHFIHNQLAPSLPRVLAHETAHECGLIDTNPTGQNDLMSSDLYTNLARFVPIDIAYLKKNIHSCGLQRTPVQH